MYEIFEQLRQLKNVTVYEISKQTGINPTFFSEWKKGKSKMPTVDKLQIIADYFGVTVDYLIGNDKETTPEDVAVMNIAQEIRDNPETQALFQLTKNATAEELKQYAEVIKALRGTYRD